MARQSVRALLVDGAHRVLLLRCGFGNQVVWAPPDGGMEAGESPLQALRHELDEELGFARRLAALLDALMTHGVPARPRLIETL